MLFRLIELRATFTECRLDHFLAIADWAFLRTSNRNGIAHGSS